jgi:ABC-2 type transport system ATP-binding protein
MRMKTALASALAFRPRLLVLDEPLSGLDPLVRDDLMEALTAQAANSTVLISSHDLAEIDSFASHVGFMDNGHLRLSAPIADVRQRFRNVEITSESPIAVPAVIPQDWIHFNHSEQSATWCESSWNQKQSEDRIRTILGVVRVTTRAMALREVFLSLAKSSGSETEGGSR